MWVPYSLAARLLVREVPLERCVLISHAPELTFFAIRGRRRGRPEFRRKTIARLVASSRRVRPAGGEPGTGDKVGERGADLSSGDRASGDNASIAVSRGGDGESRGGGSGMLRGERQSSSDQVRVDWGVKSGVSFVIDEWLRQVRGSSLTGRPGEISPEFERSRPLAKA